MDAVRAPLKSTSKKRLLQDIAGVAGALYKLPADVVCRALLERERLGPTGVGHGVAIPHACVTCLDHEVGLFVRLREAVEYEALDRQPVDLVFALLVPDRADAAHLRALASVSRKLRDDAVRQKLRSTFDPAALHAILSEQEVRVAAEPAEIRRRDAPPLSTLGRPRRQVA